MRTITREEVRSHLFQAHHLVTPADSLPEAAGVCGFQNSPPGTWLCAAFNRLRSCSAWQLQQELDEGRGIMQACSLRGAPWIFPLHDAAVYLDALCAEEGESWIYTNGLRCCQKEIGVPFSVLLQELMQCLQVLEKEPVVSKQRLDQVLAAAMLQRIPASLHSLWLSASPFAKGQLYGEAIVSFLLRPASFQRGIAFGPRQKGSPTFAAFPNAASKTGGISDAACCALVCRFLHAYGPGDVKGFAKWTGMELPQARRLWALSEHERVSVRYQEREYSIWNKDTYEKQQTDEAVRLLSPHDPFLDLWDRSLLLEDCKLQHMVWKTVQNPGVVIQCGRICGIWRSKKRKTVNELHITLFTDIDTKSLHIWIQAYEQFLGQRILVEISRL